MAVAPQSPPHAAVAAPPPPSRQEQGTAGRQARAVGAQPAAGAPRRLESLKDELGDEEDEEQRQRREEAEEAQQAAQMVATALRSGISGRSTLRNRQLLAAPPPPPGPAKPTKGGAKRGQQQAAATKAAGSGGARAIRNKMPLGSDTRALAQMAPPPPPLLTKVEAVRAALEANTQLQARLRRTLTSIERAMDRSAALLQQASSALVRLERRRSPLLASGRDRLAAAWVRPRIQP